MPKPIAFMLVALLVAAALFITFASTSDNRPQCSTVPAGYPYPCQH